jgi:PAS domain S-box-containing protein
VRFAAKPVLFHVIVTTGLVLIVHLLHRLLAAWSLCDPHHLLLTIYLLPVAVAARYAGTLMAVATAAVSVALAVAMDPQSPAVSDAVVRIVSFLAPCALLCWLFNAQHGSDAALRASQERYRQLAHHFPNGAVMLFDRDLRYLLADGQGLAVVGLSPGEMEGRTIQEVFPADLVSRIEPQYRAALAGQQQVREVAFKDHLYLTHAVPVRDASGEVVAGLVITQDISERRLLEQQLRQMQKMDALGRLAGGVAHDFNNLLAVILGRCERLTAAISEPRQHQELTAIRQAGERAAALTRQLLAFSRRQPVEPSPIDCSKVVAEMEQMLARLVTERIQITTRLDRELPPVLADKAQLEQVLLNLCVNARDAIAGRGQITIETSAVVLDRQACDKLVGLAPGRFVQIEVRDTGAGMDAATRSRLFEPFFTTKPAGQGTGLGLAIVFGVVQQSGGHIACESTPGRGSVFTIHLPAADASVAVAGTETPPTGMPILSGGETVLLVEDELNVREMIRDFLESRGYRVLTAEHAEAALALLERQHGPIDILVSDMVMPGMGGSQLNQRLHRQLPGLKSVLMSGYTEDGQIASDRIPPDTAFLQKPFALETLNQRIRSLLSGHRN